MNLKRANMNSTFGAFTLIEVVLALAISAIVLVAICTLFFGALRLRDRVSDVAAQNLPVDRAITVMKQDLMNIVPVGVLAGPMGTDATAFGTPSAPVLELFTCNGSLTTDQPWPDVEKIDYFLQAPTNQVSYKGHDIVRGVTRNLLAVNSVSPEPQTLLQDVGNLQFSFYDGTNWNNTWSTTTSNVPVAIKVNIDFNNAKDAIQRPSIEFVVPVVTWSYTNSSVTNLVSN